MSDIWVEAGRYGLLADHIFEITKLRASASHLHLGGQGPCFAVPWQNLLNGESLPVIERRDDCR
jgi:hypothetical protein